MPGLLDIIGQALSMPTALKQQQLQYQQAQMMLQQYPQYAQTLQAINASLNGQQGQQPQQQAPQPQQSAAPPQSPAQPTTSDLASGLLGGSVGMVNAAHPSGGLLATPQPSGGLLGGVSQSPTGPVTSYGLGNAPAAQSQSPPQSPPQMPQPGRPQADPLQFMRYGVQLQGLPFPQAQKEGAALVAYASSVLANDPANITRKAAAGGTLAQDQYAIDNASSDAQRQAAQIKYWKDSGQVTVANNNGAVTTLGLNPQQVQGLNLSGVNPSNGTQYSNGQMSVIPGAPGAHAAVAGATAGAESGAEYAPVYGANGQQIGFAPRNSILSQMPGAPRSGTPSSGAPGTPATGGASFGLAPGTSELLEGQGKAANDTLEQYQEQAETGKDLITQVQQVQNAAATFGPGKFANWRGEFLNLANSVPGLLSPSDQAKLGSYQEGTKVAIGMQAVMTKQLGSREAAQVFGTMGKATPNITMSPDGLDKVGGYLMGMGRYNQARAEYAQNLGNQGDVTGVNSTRQTFLDKSNPSYYIVASMSPQGRNEFLQQMPAPKRSAFIKQWNAAANAGFAPRPNAYASQ